MSLRAVSLYSGAGGLDIGFERAGFEIVFANEMNADAAATWKANRPSDNAVMCVGDIANQTQSLAQLRNIGVVFGGPPCQGFSVAGKMDKGDERNAQVDCFLDVVDRVKPCVFLMENVEALATHQKWESVRMRMLQRADEMQYDTEIALCNASRYGVPEKRSRMLFVGVKRNTGKASAFREEMLKYTSEPKTLRETLLKVGAFGTPANPDTCTARVVLAKKPVKRSSAYSGMLVNGAGRPLKLDSTAPTLTASMGGNSTPIIDQRALNNSGLRNWFECLYERIGEKGYPQIEVPSYVRRLTLKEAAAIQTFPDNYVFKGSICSQYRQIGNAVPCLMAEAAARAIRDAYFTPELKDA